MHRKRKINFMENQAQTNETQVAYAGFGKRMAALLIDRVLISLTITIVY